MHLPANTFSARHESRGERTSGSSDGTQITAAGSIDTKGSWVDLGGVTSFAYEGFTVICMVNGGTDVLFDIGISDGTNRFVIAEDIEYAGRKQVDEQNLALHIPVHVPAGSQLSARCQSSTASDFFRLHLIGHSANPGGYPGFSRAVKLFTVNGSRGTAIDPGGTANTKGSWTELIASCPADVGAIFGVVGFNGDVTRAATASMLLDIGIGAASSEFVLVPDMSIAWEATWDGPNDVFFQPIGVNIPEGSRVAARAQCSLNTAGDRTVDLALYGLGL